MIGLIVYSKGSAGVSAWAGRRGNRFVVHAPIKGTTSTCNDEYHRMPLSSPYSISYLRLERCTRNSPIWWYRWTDKHWFCNSMQWVRSGVATSWCSLRCASRRKSELLLSLPEHQRAVYESDLRVYEDEGRGFYPVWWDVHPMVRSIRLIRQATVLPGKARSAHNALPLPLASSTRIISIKSFGGVRFKMLWMDLIKVFRCSSWTGMMMLTCWETRKDKHVLGTEERRLNLQLAIQSGIIFFCNYE